MSFCTSAAKAFLIVVNTVFSFIGIGLISLGSYGIVKFSNLGNIVSLNSLWFLLSLGVFVLALSLVGVIAAWKSKKFLLSVYTVIVSVVVGLEMLAGVMIGVYVGKLDALKTNQYFSAGEKEIQNVVNCTYQLCCKLGGPAHPAELVCNSTIESEFRVNMPYAACEALNTYDATLLKLQCNSTDTFSLALYNIVKTNLYPIGGATIGLSAVQMFCLAFACYLLCIPKKQNNHDSASQPPQSDGAAGGETALVTINI